MISTDEVQLIRFRVVITVICQHDALKFLQYCLAEETIDLTTASDSDIDRAVAESLRDVQGGGIFGGQVTQEEEQISKFVSFFHTVYGK